MKNRRYMLLAVLVLGVSFLRGGVRVSAAMADSPIVIRYATLAPPGSSFGKVLAAWGRTIKKQTEGRVALRVYGGGSQGDERDVLRKMRAGQVDASGVTTTGMGMLVRPVLVLTVPGLLTEYDDLRRVSSKLRGRFNKLFERAGVRLLAWGDGGKNRLFSTRIIAKPDDLKRARPWAWKDDPVFAEFIRVIGANPVRVGAMEVYPGLQTRMIDVAPASCIVAVAFQWHTRLKYMVKDNLSLILGGSIITQEKFDALTPGDQKILIDTAERTTRASDKIVRRDDLKAYQLMLKRGIEEIDTSPHKAAWDAVALKTREQLAGRVYSKSLLEAVEAEAAAP